MINKIQVESILNKHKKRDDWFLGDYSVTPYSGSSFNCIYCYTRGSKYGTNLAKVLSVKISSPELLEKQLSKRAKNAEYGIILFVSQEAYIPILRNVY
jgi:DNA repair photolyase